MSADVLSALAAGFALGASLIIAIGAQNAFVLRQGLARDHTFAVALTCVLCDVTLIAAGAVGFGGLVARFPTVASVAAWGGAAFLAVYGALSLRSALRPHTLRAEDAPAHGMFASTGSAVTATLAISLLNPHVYLDTVVLLGSVASQYPAGMRTWFTLGAMVGIDHLVLRSGLRGEAARAALREAGSLARSRWSDRRDHVVDRREPGAGAARLGAATRR